MLATRPGFRRTDTTGNRVTLASRSIDLRAVQPRWLASAPAVRALSLWRCWRNVVMRIRLPRVSFAKHMIWLSFP